MSRQTFYPFTRWPLLLAALVLLLGAVLLDINGKSSAVSWGIGGLGAACLGAFLYAEGVRHVAWEQEHEPERHEEP